MRNSRKGSVLVFLTCIMVSVVMIVTVLCEAASAMAARSVSEAAVELACRSVLASYDRDLKERYHLFGCSLDKTEMEEQLKVFTEHMFADSDHKKKLVKCRLESADVDLSEHSLLRVDVLEHQILEHMKYRIADSVFGVDLKQDAEELSLAEKLLEKTEPIYQLYEEIIDKKEKLRRDWESWNQLQRQTSLDEDDYQRLTALERKINRKLSEMKQLRNKAFDRISDFHRCAAQITSETGREMETVTELKKDVQRLEQELKNLGDMSIHSLSYNRDEKGSEEERKKLKEKLENLQKQFSMEGLGAVTGLEEEDYRTLRNTTTVAELPSVLYGKKPVEFPSVESITDIHSLLVKGRNNLYSSMYVKEMFKSRVSETDGADTFFKNEMEYVLFGSYSDKTNGDYAAFTLFALRSAVNGAHVYSCLKKKAQATALAAAMTPGPAAPITQKILLAVWAAAEAANDVKRLLDGERVPLVKTEADWRLSLEGILEGASQEKPGISAGDSQKGLSYEEYLSLFLLLKNREEKLTRVMDLIQLNMKGSSDGSFRLKDRLSGLTVRCQVIKSGSLAGSRRGTIAQAHIY